MWPEIVRPGNIVSLDSVLWSVLNLWVHGTSLLGLLFHDERPIPLNDEKGESALWRMLYRHGGISRQLFKETVCNKFRIIELEKGIIIPTDRYFYIVYEGYVKADIVYWGGSKGRVSSVTIKSGEAFDIKHLQLLHQTTAFANQHIYAESTTQVKLFQFDACDIKDIAHSPLTKGVWQAFLISMLCKIAERSMKQDRAGPRATAASGASTSSSFSSSPWHDPIFRPLEDWEEPSPLQAGSGMVLLSLPVSPLKHIWFSVKKSFRPPWPFRGWTSGLRHGSLPAPRAEALEQMEAMYQC